MKTITEYIEARRKRMKEKRGWRLIGRSQELYQITEYNNELWLTFNGSLVCPMNMFTDEPIMALAKIRDHFVERNTTEEKE